MFLCAGCSWGGGLWPLWPTLRPSWPLLAQPFHASHLDAWILLPLVVVFSMAQLSLEVSYKPSLCSAQP